MSLGSVFTLINNVGSADKLLFANEYLKNRINAFIKNKNPSFSENELLSQPDDTYLNVSNSVLPSLNEIEKSHSTFVNGSYKPGIMLTSEYFRVGNARPEFDSQLIFQLPQIGQFTTDTMLHIRLSGLSAIDTRDRVRYTAMLGHKLIKHVQLTVNNGNLVDEFDTDDFNAYYQFEVDANHKNGYLRNIGQETPHLGSITSDPVTDMHSEYRSISDGNQTLKQSHGTIDLYIPLLFWFKNIKTALPSIPWGQIQIKVMLSKITDIVGFADNGGGGLYTPPVIEFCDLYTNQLFTTPEIFSLYAKKFVFNIIRVHRHHKELIKVDRNNKYDILLNNLKWPTEQLYFSFRPRENLKLSQYWHKNVKLTEKVYKVPVVAKDPSTVITGNFSLATQNTAVLTSDTVLSTVTNMYNNYDIIITGGSGYNSKDIVQNRYFVQNYNGVTNTVTILGVWNDGAKPDTTTIYELSNAQLAINMVSYYKETPIVESISLEASGVEIYKNQSEAFYNSYITSKYKNINTPDMGSYMMTFCINPNMHSPSGSLNVSLCRELYLRFTSKVIEPDYSVDLIVLAKAINFLLIDSGNLSLRYNL
jgi:hypothetical protein